MVNVLISRCLLGEKCRYDGKGNSIDRLCEIKEKCNLIPVCPECDGGLSTPRLPSEIRNGRVYMTDGKDVTEEFARGAQAALDTALKNGCDAAILKAKSPSCGSGKIYDGTFSGTLTDGDGITAQLLKKRGIRVFSEKQTTEILKYLEEQK